MLLVMDYKLGARIFVILGIVIGAFLTLKPLSAINLQIKFYKLINWRIEPISMQKELRSTRIMGVFLFICSIIAIWYYVSQLQFPLTS